MARKQRALDFSICCPAGANGRILRSIRPGCSGARSFRYRRSRDSRRGRGRRRDGLAQVSALQCHRRARLGRDRRGSRAISVAATLLFAKIAEDVTQRESLQFDAYVRSRVLVPHGPFMDRLFEWLTWIGSGVVLIAICGLAAALRRWRSWWGSAACISPSIGQPMSSEGEAQVSRSRRRARSCTSARVTPSSTPFA